ncbi:SDR family NAD(P)-dependent oxidoreductase [Streptomyces turgidiscabies]|uniref:Oxidoreductase, short chain dehydrogenase/reductase family protein n=1 Tax=Streptomyces turgidiscabies (strain Car8) TaxID=698760 RepID=L7ET26_STRT8|nr:MULTISPECIES: SDR family NAD(P)-dependent oxidoreductase [Streptomyces]ELP62568.1 oxidoreductase, short chain dehydrogenase/reductase family protein [Streptomyces turgidiscabies Car8]MDX3494861.1 SDR family NAD(P)-dependent oxidoreductase [Streptomyces turgidiscabies]GAQ71476.1 putative oxidoreductase [Streptomyces turgidiscabies]
MPTIAIVGAGPGMGLAIARAFGSRGFDVALISRTKEKLQTLVGHLGKEGITAEAFAADVLDRPSLTAALDAVKARFGGIDVLEYSPAPHSPVPGVTLAAPSEVTADNLQPQIEYVFYGAVAAARTVLPAMREAGSGTLLFTSGGGSVDPVPMLGNVNAAGAALRNWVINLNKELAGSGVHAAHVAINVWIGDGGPEGFPTATSEEIAPLYWDLHENRDRSEAVFNA